MTPSLPTVLATSTNSDRGRPVLAAQSFSYFDCTSEHAAARPHSRDTIPVGSLGASQRLLEDISGARGAKFRLPPIITEFHEVLLTGFWKLRSPVDLLGHQVCAIMHGLRRED